ncbi:PLDc N-terminal domain-containing protein [Salinibacterium sp. PAMC 21357]|uniref:PLDc N-terminal domain-containing protein n=1 Tax=Salinibacterium sp. PAMC 21357 TaxID=1112215 RepID=UPI0002892AFB|nr:PLDc N-terminal domain-containing protein [Salinibacterium sp. PAMC 21357]
MVELTALNLVIVLGIIAFYIVTVWAIVVTVRDPTTFPWMTALWIAALILFPGIGLLAWLLWRVMRKNAGLPGFTRESHRKH